MGLTESQLFYGTYDEHRYQTLSEMSEQLVLLAAQINVATYHFLKMLAEFDRREGWRQLCMTSCCHWLNCQCGISFITAREKLRVAHCLERLPQINKAFKAGKLSYSKVRAMTRVATDENEHILLNAAMEVTANQMDKLVRRYQRVDEKQNLIEQVDELQQRSLDYYQDEEGMWVFSGRLPSVEGGLLVKALEEIIRQQNKNDSAGAKEKVTHGQKRADAISALAEHFIATAKVDDENGGLQALAGHERCQVVLHLNIGSLKASHNESHTHSEHSGHHIDNQWISLENAKRFSSDASLYTVLEDKYGNVLNVGRKTRTVTTALKRALDIRDETCRFPGCCANKYVDFHHVHHWCEGGKTEPDNLIKLCRFHHNLLHKGHYTITLLQQHEDNVHRKWLFKTEFGEVIESNTLPNGSMAQHNLKIRWPKTHSGMVPSVRQDKAFNYSRIVKLMNRANHR